MNLACCCSLLNCSRWLRNMHGKGRTWTEHSYWRLHRTSLLFFKCCITRHIVSTARACRYVGRYTDSSWQNGAVWQDAYQNDLNYVFFGNRKSVIEVLDDYKEEKQRYFGSILTRQVSAELWGLPAVVLTNILGHVLCSMLHTSYVALNFGME